MSLPDERPHRSMILEYDRSTAFASKRWRSVAGVILTFIAIFMLFHSRQRLGYDTLRSTDQINSNFKTSTSVNEIPNIAHFIHLTRSPLDGQDTLTLDLPLYEFLSIYSAYLHLRPSRTHIWTNIPSSSFSTPLNEFAYPYFSALQRMPNVSISEITPPTKSSSGLPITSPTHQADLLWPSILMHHGGIYLRSDVYVLHDFSPLRRTGFESVLGYEEDGKASNAVIMTVPNGQLITALSALAPRVYDGTDEAHTTHVLSRLARDFSFAGATNSAAAESAALPLLTLPSSTFTPGSSYADSIRALYDPTSALAKGKVSAGCFDDNSVPSVGNLTAYAEAVVEEGVYAGKDEWDLCGAYAFSGRVRELERMDLGLDFGGEGGPTLGYLRSGKSFFAKAVKAIVEKAIEEGWLRREETRGVGSSPGG